METFPLAVVRFEVSYAPEGRRLPIVAGDPRSAIRNAAIGSGLRGAWCRTFLSRVGAESTSDAALAPYIAAGIQGAWVEVGEILLASRTLRVIDLRTAYRVRQTGRHGGSSGTKADLCSNDHSLAAGPASCLLVSVFDIFLLHVVFFPDTVTVVTFFDDVVGAGPVLLRLRGHVWQ